MNQEAFVITMGSSKNVGAHIRWKIDTTFSLITYPRISVELVIDVVLKEATL